MKAKLKGIGSTLLVALVAVMALTAPVTLPAIGLMFGTWMMVAALGAMFVAGALVMEYGI